MIRSTNFASSINCFVDEPGITLWLFNYTSYSSIYLIDREQEKRNISSLRREITSLVMRTPGFLKHVSLIWINFSVLVIFSRRSGCSSVPDLTTNPKRQILDTSRGFNSSPIVEYKRRELSKASMVSLAGQFNQAWIYP